MSPLRTFAALSCAAVLAAASALVACETETPTSVLVDNGYPALSEGGAPAQQTVVYRAFWGATYFADPVAGGATSSEQRSAIASELAYAVLAPGWDPASSTPPARFVVVKSKASLASVRGELLRIAVSDLTFTGNCLAGQPLSQEDADFLTQRVFPGEFANVAYDARTCTSTTLPDGDAAADGPADGAKE